VKNASGLFNLTRNLRGAIGLAALTTILNDRTDLHLARLHERLTFASKPALETLDALAQQRRHGSDAKAMALNQLMQMTHTQGLVMALCRCVLPANAAVRGTGRPCGFFGTHLS
jgi:MFS transporter, DHA2 family, multidrug resistance protein